MISSFVYGMAPAYLSISTFSRKHGVLSLVSLIISHIVQLSLDPPCLCESVIAQSDSVNKRKEKITI